VRRRFDKLREAEGIERRVLALAHDRYRSGLVDFLDGLETERTLCSVQTELARSERRLPGSRPIVQSARRWLGPRHRQGAGNAISVAHLVQGVNAMNDPFKTYDAFSWCELMTPDPEAATRFYGTLFGWTLEDMDMGRGTYTVVKAGGAAIGGIMKRPPECAPDAPPHWGTYVTVEDVDATARTAEALGAKTLVPPTDLPKVGRFYMLQDPQGAVIAAITYV